MANPLGNAAKVVIATLAGLWIGSLLRARLFGRPTQWLRFEFVDANGRLYKSMPVSTKLYPALLCTLIGRPRWLFGGLGGVAAGTLIDDVFEERLLRWIIARTTSMAAHEPDSDATADAAMLE